MRMGSETQPKYLRSYRGPKPTILRMMNSTSCSHMLKTSIRDHSMSASTNNSTPSTRDTETKSLSLAVEEVEAHKAIICRRLWTRSGVTCSESIPSRTIIAISSRGPATPALLEQELLLGAWQVIIWSGHKIIVMLWDRLAKSSQVTLEEVLPQTAPSTVTTTKAVPLEPVKTLSNRISN